MRKQPVACNCREAFCPHVGLPEQENKFLVVKWERVETYLTEEEQKLLDSLMERLSERAKADGKKTDHWYAVVNQDEPYFPEIRDIMKRNGHW